MLGNVQELLRHHLAAHGMYPANERLVRENLARLQLEHRLIVERELIVLQRPAQLLREVRQVHDGELHRTRAEHDRAVLVGLSRGGQRGSGAFEQGLAGRAILRKTGETESGSERNALVAIRQRLCKGTTNSICGVPHCLSIQHSQHQHDEQVTADSAERRQMWRRLARERCWRLKPLQSRRDEAAAGRGAEQVARIAKPAEMNGSKGERRLA